MGVQAGVVALRLDVAHGRPRHELRGARQLDGDHLVLVGVVAHRLGGGRGATGDDPVERRGEPLGAQGLEEVVDGADLVGVDRPVVVRGDEHDRRRHGHRGEHPGELQTVEPRHPDVEEHDLDVATLGNPHARHGVECAPADRLSRRGRLTHALTAVEDAQGVGGVRRLQDDPYPGVFLQQVGQFFERWFLVIYGEDNQAAGAVVAVHDLLILRVRYAASERPRGDHVRHRRPW